MIDAELLSYATVRQVEYLEQIEISGSNRKAALALGIDATTIDKSIKRLRATAAKQGHSPAHSMTHTVPIGFKVKGVSTLYNTKGEIASQWVKSTADDQAQADALSDFAQMLSDGVKGLSPITPAPTHCNADLMSVYPIGDPHFGLRSWVEEGGDDFSLDEAERLTCSAIDRLIACSPPSATAMLLNLGDHFHADNQSNTTTAGTVVDVDGRWAKVQQVGLRSMLYAIRRLLEKHEKVIFRINRGNHDKHSSYALALMIDCYFHDEPRVEVSLSPAAAYYYLFGKVLIASTHGDTLKGTAMPALMAVDQPEMWFQSKFRYWMCGHVHHSNRVEYPGALVEYFRTLAAGDAWHNGQGYRSGRDMCCIVMHKDFGEVERHVCNHAMLLQ
jgi:hypothetical protein